MHQSSLEQSPVKISSFTDQNLPALRFRSTSIANAVSFSVKSLLCTLLAAVRTGIAVYDDFSGICHRRTCSRQTGH